VALTPFPFICQAMNDLGKVLDAAARAGDLTVLRRHIEEEGKEYLVNSVADDQNRFSLLITATVAKRFEVRSCHLGPATRTVNDRRSLESGCIASCFCVRLSSTWWSAGQTSITGIATIARLFSLLAMVAT
jgi:hypothetical protein